MNADWSVRWCLILQILHQNSVSESEIFQVLGPADPVIAVVGEDVVLPTYLKPNISAEDMYIEWYRRQTGVPLVHLYTEGESRNGNQNPSYSGRTAVFPEELKKGNTSLRLSRVRVSDEGQYWCYIRSTSYSQYDYQIKLSLEVRAVGTKPVIFIEAGKQEEVGLLCESKGWYPQPDLIWQDGEGHKLTNQKTEMLRDSLDLITIRSHVTIQRKGPSRFTCRVLQQKLHLEKMTEFHLLAQMSEDPGTFFEIGTVIFFTVAAIVIILAVNIPPLCGMRGAWEESLRDELPAGHGADADSKHPSNTRGCPYYNPRPRQRIPRDLAMCVTPSGQFYCSMCNAGAGEEAHFRLHLESKPHKSKVSEQRYRSEMETLGYS